MTKKSPGPEDQGLTGYGMRKKVSLKELAQSVPKEWGFADAAALGLNSERVARLQAHMEAAVTGGETPGISVALAREGCAAILCAGRPTLAAVAAPVTSETVFLVASVTKPVVAAAVMLLVERGHLALDQPAAEALPEFEQSGKEAVTIRHLLTHTSGLPDMLPENQALREEHAPLSEFVRRVCRLRLEFPPGTRIQYQSMGTATLGAIVERVDGRNLPRFLKEEFFEPLGMEASCLGLEPRLADRTARNDLSIPGTGSDIGARETDWGWNSDYWHRFGAPWGGMFSTPLDLCRFLQMFAAGGAWGDTQLLSPATVRAMTRCHTDLMPELPEAERRRQSWGLGWRLNRSAAGFPFGDLLSPDAYGHAGATGTMVWNDPATGLSAAIFCNRPLAQSNGLLHQCSSLLAAAHR
jgi:CubicO group peptidase (beta-lactamase class C family)